MASTTYVTPRQSSAMHDAPLETLGETSRSEIALQRVEHQVQRIWEALQPAPVAARTIFAEAMRRAAPVVPCVVTPRPSSARDLNRDLRTALVNYHAEEIRVVGYTLLSSILELVHETCGKRFGQCVERILDSFPPTTH